MGLIIISPSVPVGIFAVVLAVVGAVVTHTQTSGWKRICLTVLFVHLGAAEVVVIVRADHAHDAEVKKFGDDLSGIQKKLDDSEVNRRVDEAYLRAKWEDSQASLAQLSRFAPAIMKLAQTSADYQKKQFETKITSNKELYALAMDVVKRSRELASKYQRERIQDMNAPIGGKEMEALTPAQKDQRYGQERNRMLQTAYKQDSDFRQMVLADAKYIADEVRQRNVPEPRNPSDPIRIAEHRQIARIRPGAIADREPTSLLTGTREGLCFRGTTAAHQHRVQGLLTYPSDRCPGVSVRSFSSRKVQSI